MTDDMAVMAAKWGVVVEAQTQEDEDCFEVADANWASLLFFLDCDTQWRVSPVGMTGLLWIGLDYAACDVVARRNRIGDEVWDDLRIMEQAALPELNTRDE